MREVRKKLRLCSQARVVGVAFFDFKHGQTGVAPNAIERVIGGALKGTLKGGCRCTLVVALSH